MQKLWIDAPQIRWAQTTVRPKAATLSLVALAGDDDITVCIRRRNFPGQASKRYQLAGELVLPNMTGTLEWSDIP